MLNVRAGVVCGGEWQTAMNVIGLGAEEQKSVLRLVSAVLHLGNIRFVDQSGKAKVENRNGEASRTHSHTHT
jgi:myosin heavy subunit